MSSDEAVESRWEILSSPSLAGALLLHDARGVQSRCGLGDLPRITQIECMLPEHFAGSTLFALPCNLSRGADPSGEGIEAHLLEAKGSNLGSCGGRGGLGALKAKRRLEEDGGRARAA